MLQGVSGVNNDSTKPLFHPKKGTCLQGVCSLYGFPQRNYLVQLGYKPRAGHTREPVFSQSARFHEKRDSGGKPKSI
jgi:hypothetical protein